MKMKDKMLQAVGSHAKGMAAKHKMNVDVYLNNPTGIGEHSCVVESVVHELEELGKWTDILRTLEEEYGFYA
tara:strand:+ start:288 stop:503 length:216 start_codon:yes stop_codon:yes gene_type:complete